MPSHTTGLDALRRLVAVALVTLEGERAFAGRAGILLSEAVRTGGHRISGVPSSNGTAPVSSEPNEADRQRLIALVELARGGDVEAFGLLYDHYQPQVYRFLYYRLRSAPLAEDLTSDTFFRALRSIEKFTWQGKDFGAWLMTIARNLAHDHFKSSKTRLEMPSDDMTRHDETTDGPEGEVLANLTNERLMVALRQLPAEQRDCLIMRFLQGLSISETAEALGRSEGAVKQLQYRAVRSMAKRIPEEEI